MKNHQENQAEIRVLEDITPTPPASDVRISFRAENPSYRPLPQLSDEAEQRITLLAMKLSARFQRFLRNAKLIDQNFSNEDEQRLFKILKSVDHLNRFNPNLRALLQDDMVRTAEKFESNQ